MYRMLPQPECGDFGEGFGGSGEAAAPHCHGSVFLSLDSSHIFPFIREGIFPSFFFFSTFFFRFLFILLLPWLPYHFHLFIEDSSKTDLFYFLFMFYLPRYFTILDFPSVSFLASLPFSSRYRTTTPRRFPS